MAFMMTSSPIVVHNSSQSFGNHYSRSLRSRSSYILYIILRLMDKQKGLTKSWNNIYIVPSTTIKIKLLLLAKFVYNNTIQRSTHQIQFFANYGYHPKFDQFDFNNVKNPTTRDLVTRFFEIYTKMKDKLLEAQDQQKDNIDKS